MGAGPCGINVIVFVVFGAWGRFDVRLSLCLVSARISSGVGSWKVGVVNTTEGCRGVWILGGGSGSIGGLLLGSNLDPYCPRQNFMYARIFCLVSAVSDWLGMWVLMFLQFE